MGPASMSGRFVGGEEVPVRNRPGGGSRRGFVERESQIEVPDIGPERTAVRPDDRVGLIDIADW